MKIKKKKPTVDLNHARVPEQIRVMKKIIEAGDDPFSMENLSKYHKKPILKETKHWLVTENQWPYDGAKLHFLLISKKYAETLDDLSSDARADFMECLNYMIKKYKIKGGAYCMRIGETSLSGATVKHLHAQLVVPDLTKKRVAFYLGDPTKSNNQKTKRRIK